jgi:aspartate aminotransferase
MIGNSFAARVSSTSPSYITHLAEIVAGMEQSGIDIAGLQEGELDFDADERIVSGTIRALMEGKTRYSWLQGEVRLREAICRKLSLENGINACPDEIVVSNGSTQALYQIFQCLIEVGDEVIVPVPCWPSYPEAIRMAGGVPVFTTIEGNDLEVRSVVSNFTKKTKIVIVNTPNNPSGAVYTKEALLKLGEAVRLHGAYLVCDEAYERFVYPPHRHFSPGSLPGSDHVITVQSFSKSFAMTGFRIGYAVGHRDIIARLSSLQSHLSDNVCTFAQYGALAALEAEEGRSEAWRDALRRRRDLALEVLSGIVECAQPAGGFYLFPNVERHFSSRMPDSMALCEYLLRQHHVAVAPGEAFQMPGHIRISFSSSPSNIERGLMRLRHALA